MCVISADLWVDPQAFHWSTILVRNMRKFLIENDDSSLRSLMAIRLPEDVINIIEGANGSILRKTIIRKMGLMSLDERSSIENPP